VGRKHLDQEQKEHQPNDAEDDDEDDDGDGHEHVDSRVGEAVLDLFIFLVASAVDLTVAEKLASDALWLFCAWTSSIVMIVCRTMLLKRGDHQFQLLVKLAFG